MASQHSPKYANDPSLAAAATFAVLFVISATAHLVQLLRTRTWCFIAFLLGVLLEIVGFACRAYNASESPDWSRGPFVVQLVLPLIAPALFTASIYMALDPLITSMGVRRFSISTKWLRIFVLADVLTLAAKCISGGVLAGADSYDTVYLGRSIILFGVAIQFFFFAVFIVIVSILHYRIVCRPTSTSLLFAAPWKQYIWVIYMASLLITIRSSFKIAEFAVGSQNVLETSEAYLYCLDVAPMLLCSVLFNLWHPSRVMLSCSSQSFRPLELEDGGMSTPDQQTPARRISYED
ncbi:hypothetical protein QQX98_007077 [Neonectria punicea]|uniref:Uncharacterized protein n=1 Tax=Neonectria punicea TaxID=979145 RepID=A0ABR1GYV5_9HYPO